MKKSTKALLVLIFTTIGALLSSDPFMAAATAAIGAHQKWAIIGTLLTVAGALVHNPKVQKLVAVMEQQLLGDDPQATTADVNK